MEKEIPGFIKPEQEELAGSLKVGDVVTLIDGTIGKIDKIVYRGQIQMFHIIPMDGDENFIESKMLIASAFHVVNKLNK